MNKFLSLLSVFVFCFVVPVCCSEKNIINYVDLKEQYKCTKIYFIDLIKDQSEQNIRTFNVLELINNKKYIEKDKQSIDSILGNNQSSDITNIKKDLVKLNNNKNFFELINSSDISNFKKKDLIERFSKLDNKKQIVVFTALDKLIKTYEKDTDNFSGNQYNNMSVIKYADDEELFNEDSSCPCCTIL